MRRVLPRERWERIGRVVTFFARKPARATGGTARDLPVPDPMWDFGGAGCEEGVLLKLRTLVATLEAGQVLEVRSTDPGAPEDLPAWCRMTGHDYLGASGTRYFVRKR